MFEQVDRILSQTVSRMADNIASFLPGVVVLLVVLVASLVLAVLIRLLVHRLLMRFELDRRAQEVGFSIFVQLSPSRSPSLFVARCAQWAILLVGLLTGLSALNAAVPGQFALVLFQYLPNVLAALVILVVGDLASRMLARSVLINAVNLHIQHARLISGTLKWLVLVLAGAMALDHLGIGRQILLLAFGILFGGIVFAVALAVGLGSAEMVRRAWEQGRSTREENKLDHV